MGLETMVLKSGCRAQLVGTKHSSCYCFLIPKSGANLNVRRARYTSQMLSSQRLTAMTPRNRSTLVLMVAYMMSQLVNKRMGQGDHITFSLEKMQQEHSLLDVFKMILRRTCGVLRQCTCR